MGSFYMQMASEWDPDAALAVVAEHLGPTRGVFVGVIDVNDPTVETPGQVQDRIHTAAAHIPVAQLGTTDDCGFSPFSDDDGTSREIAFAKIAARVVGTKLAEQEID